MLFLPTFLITYFTGEPAKDVLDTDQKPGTVINLFGLVIIIIFSSLILRKWL